MHYIPLSYTLTHTPQLVIMHDFTPYHAVKKKTFLIDLPCLSGFTQQALAEKKIEIFSGSCWFLYTGFFCVMDWYQLMDPNGLTGTA